jgi:hypothetical protein
MHFVVDSNASVHHKDLNNNTTGETTMIAFLAIIAANVAILGVVALCDPYRD